MGSAGFFSCLNRNGDHYHFDYLSEETPYSKIKEYFPEIETLYCNGPMEGEDEAKGAICIGKNNEKSTTVPVGFKHSI